MRHLIQKYKKSNKTKMSFLQGKCLQSGVCFRSGDQFFKRSMHYRKEKKEEKTRLKWQHFPLHPPSQLLHSRGFLRAHPTQHSQALLHMAQPGMEPLWVAECILILSH